MCTGEGCAKFLVKPYGKARGHFATFNEYHTTFDLLNLENFHYLISVLTRKASTATITFLDDVLAPFGVVADRDFAPNLQHFKFFALVVTSRHVFERDTIVEFEKGKTTHLDFEFFKPYAWCAGCFSLKHVAKDCLIGGNNLPKQITEKIPQPTPNVAPSVEVQPNAFLMEKKLPIKPMPLVVSVPPIAPMPPIHTSPARVYRFQVDNEDKDYCHLDHLEDQAQVVEEEEIKWEQVEVDIHRSQCSTS